MDALTALTLVDETNGFVNEQFDGTFWRRTDEPDSGVDLTLYHGAAGIVLFQLEVGEARDDSGSTERAMSAGRTLAKRLLQKTHSSVAFATGWPGYAFTFRVLAQHATSDDDRTLFSNALTHCNAELMKQATRFDRGIGWIEPMPFSDITGHSGEREIYDMSVGAAGAGLGLLDSYEHGLAPDALAWAVDVAERLLQVEETTPDGKRWALMADMPFPFTAPNFAHGGAGVGYFLARLHEATGNQNFLDAAISAATYTMSRAQPVGGGCLVCHTEEQQPPAYYLGACHGPAGTGRLLGLLCRLTGDDTWQRHADALLEGIRGLGAPANRSWGWWNNYAQCCGDAGLGDYALAMWKSSGDDRYLELAHDCAEVIATTAVRAEGMARWPQAEHRARPKFVQAQTGYMQGAAGIGSFLIHLATAEASKPVRIVFPDQKL